ncbi:MAG: MMPL family transporter [Bacteroidota bacterium]
MSPQLRRISIITFSILAVLSVFFALQLKFTFRLEQFFPQGDKDLEFYQNFIEEFETDINFLLVSVERQEGVFEQSFLEKFQDFTIKSGRLPHIKSSQSLTEVSYPLKTPFGLTTIPAIHVKEPSKYPKDKARILQDSRFVNTLIDEKATALVVALKTADTVALEESTELILALDALVQSYAFEDYHYLGPAYFQKEMVAMQKREITVSALVSGLLVSLIMFWIFRRPWGITISLVSIALGLLLFLGLLGVWGRPLNAMAALYPVLMIIVGTSDVIHIMSKYIDELRKGHDRMTAIRTTIREIGLATLLTSITTAIGFATLVTSRVLPIRDFGLNAAIGVLVAYITVIFFTTALLSMLRVEQIIKIGRGQQFWEKAMQWAYDLTLQRPKAITISAVVILGISLLGISQISTNYRIESNLPRGEKISSDFLYFEQTFAGFRPLEFAIFAQGDYAADDYDVLRQIDKLEQHLQTIPAIQSVNSVTTIYKSINQIFNSNRREAYEMPDSKKDFKKYGRLVSKMPKSELNVLLSKDNKKARISSRILDLGADSIKVLSQDLDRWIGANIDSTVVKVKQTGTGLILDKNSGYVRKNLLQGLGLAVVIISFLMALLFRNISMVIISLVPNVFPLLVAGALLGYLGIELEAGIAIIFAVVFGIAVDDTIHFLSKFKLARNKGMSIEESLHITFLETGKAICLTSLVLFFGFLVMLFSIHPPSVTVGLLISLTLISAIISDLMLIPLLIRAFMRDEKNPAQ